nr:mitochondrial inner membrane protein COX18 [Onthophagus taurus]
MNVIRGSNLLKTCVQKHTSHLGLLTTFNKNDFYSSNQQKRSFSVESTIRAQSGFFKTLSESTPVEYIQSFLLQVHDKSGLPWWATIICTTILLRSCVTLPFAIYQQRILAKYGNLSMEMPAIVEELKKEMHVAVRRFEWDEKTAQYYYRKSVKKQWNNLIIRDNCHPLKAGILLIFQIPLWISYSVSLRNLVYQLPVTDVQSQITFTELCVGGFGWIPNLVEVDSSLILPVFLGLINLTIIEIQALAKVNPPGKLQKIFTNFFRLVSIGMIPLAANVPSCLTLYWTTSSAFGLAQNLVLMSPKIKRFVGIPLTKNELQEPYSFVYDKLKNKLSKIPGFK